MRLLRVFIGYDARTPMAYHVLVHSINRNASFAISICPLILDQLPIQRHGLTDFTFSRYLVPWLCDYDENPAIFIDSDILVLGDIYDLVNDTTPNVPVCVRKHERRFEWPAVMVFRPDLCRDLTPEFIETAEPQKFSWASEVGEIPDQWHHILPYDPPMPDAKLIHYTAGVPEFPEIRDLEMAYTVEWWAEYGLMQRSCSWLELMGSSIHAPIIIDMIKEKVAKRYEPRSDSSSPPT